MKTADKIARMSGAAQARLYRRLLAAALERVPGRALRLRASDAASDLGIAVEGDEIVLALGDRKGGSLAAE